VVDVVEVVVGGLEVEVALLEMEVVDMVEVVDEVDDEVVLKDEVELVVVVVVVVAELDHAKVAVEKIAGP
jgi:hypothetical protein